MKRWMILMTLLVVAISSGILLYEHKYRIEEYDYQQHVLETSDEAREFYSDFDRCCTMGYEEYSSFCEKYDISQKYKNEDLHYVVYAKHFMGASDFRIKRISASDDKVTINTSEENWGAVGAITLRLIVIPTEINYADDKIVYNNQIKPDELYQ